MVVADAGADAGVVAADAVVLVVAVAADGGTENHPVRSCLHRPGVLRKQEGGDAGMSVCLCDPSRQPRRLATRVGGVGKTR